MHARVRSTSIASRHRHRRSRSTASGSRRTSPTIRRSATSSPPTRSSTTCSTPSRDVLTYTSPTSRRPGRHVVHRPAHRRGPRHAPQRLQGAGPTTASAPSGAPATTSTARSWRSARRRRWFAQADPAFADNVRRYYEKVREEDLLTTHTLIPPQANRSVGAAQQVDGGTLEGARRQGGRQRRRGPRRPPAGHDRPDRRRAPRVPLDRAEGHARGRALLVRVRDQLRRARPALRLPRGHGPRPLRTSTTRWAQPLRGDGRASSIFDDVHVPYERCFLLGQPAALQRLLRRHDRGGPHDPPGRDAHDGQDGGDPAGPDLAA